MKSKIINNYLLILILITLVKLPLYSCDCIPTSDKFIDNLKERQIIIHARVIEQIKSDPENFMYSSFEGITKLIVIHSFKAKIWKDTLIHINTSPSFCGSSIQDLKENQEVFLKAYITDEFKLYKEFYSSEIKDFKENQLISSICEKHPNISSMNCDAAIIPVIDGKATGRITRKYSKEWKKYRRLQTQNSDKAEKYFEKNILNKDLSEKFQIHKTYALIDKSLKANR